MSSVYLTGESLTKQKQMSVNYDKKMYFSVGALEYLSANLLKIAVKKLNLSINFVKNELLHNRLLRILRARIYGIFHISFYATYMYFLINHTSIGKMYFLLFLSLSSKNKNCLLPNPFLTIYHYFLFPLSEGFEKHI